MFGSALAIRKAFGKFVLLSVLSKNSNIRSIRKTLNRGTLIKYFQFEKSLVVT
jgi:hypothetical protein